jgi:hypothetical protein
MGNQILTQPQTFKSASTVMGASAGLSAVSGLTVYGDISASGSVYGLNNTLAKNEMTGNGGTTYTLATYPSQNAEDYIVAVDGVVQTAGTAYSISGSSLIFTAAVASGSSIVALVSRGITQNSTNIPSFKKNELSTTSGTAAYTLSYYSNNNAENYLVFLDGVMQSPTTDYTIAGNQITLIPTPSTTGLKLIVMSLQNVDGTYATTAAVDITGKIDKPSSPSAGQVLAYNGSTWVAAASGSSGSDITSGTAVTLTNQTSVDFTGIPSTAKRITVMMSGISTSGTSIPQIQVGSGSIATTGYASQAWAGSGGGVITSGLILTNSNHIASYSYNIIVVINLLNNNKWISSHIAGLTSTTSNGWVGSGTTPDLGGALDRVRLTTVGGTETFDAGTVNIMWE